MRVTGTLFDQGGAANCLVPLPADFRLFGPGTAGVFINVVAVGALGDGHLTIIPSEMGVTTASSALNFSTGQTIANGILVLNCTLALARLCSSDITIQMGPSAAHVVIDITGYVYWPGP